MALTLMLAGCTPVAEPGGRVVAEPPAGSIVAPALGEVGYGSDERSTATPASAIVAGPQARARLAAELRSLEAEDLAQAVEGQPADVVMFTLAYDACTRTDPVLTRDDGVLVPFYRVSYTRSGCVQPVDTYAVFAAPGDAVPRPVRYRPCPWQPEGVLTEGTPEGPVPARC